LNILQLDQLIGFSKSLTGILHFCYWYFWVEIWMLQHDSIFIIQNFLEKYFPFQNEISFMVACLILPWRSGFYSAFQRIAAHLVPFLIKKIMLIFAPTDIYIYTYIYMLYMCIYIYMYIIPNFIENPVSKFNKNWIRWLRVC
jgi:hypothetical protein